MKPGYRSTEFWLSLFAVLVGAVQSSGALEGSDTATKIVGMVAVILGAFGYQVTRMVVKNADITAKAVVAVAPSASTASAPTTNPTT